MLKRKAFNRIFFTTIIFFIVFTFYNLKLVSSDNIKDQEKENKKTEVIYTLNDDNYISKTEVYVGKVFTLEDKIKEKLQIMIENNNKNALLPSYFKPILPENTKVEDVIVDNSIVKVYFSKELSNINKEQSEKMIEAIVYTITDENILGIEIYVDGQLLKYVPHTKKELPTVLTKDFGINKTYEVISTKDISKVVMTYYGNYNDIYYEVPVTKYVNDKREKLEIVFSELMGPSLDNNLISPIENIKLENYKIDSNEVMINLNKGVNNSEVDLIVKCIFNNYDVEKVKVLINNEKKFEKTREKY